MHPFNLCALFVYAPPKKVPNKVTECEYLRWAAVVANIGSERWRHVQSKGISPSGLDGGWFLSLLRDAIYSLPLSLGSWGTMITLSKRGRQVFLSFRQSHPLPPLSKERLILATPLCASFHKVSLTHFFIFGKAIPSSSIALLPKHNPALLR